MKRGFVCGSFDLLHLGHMYFFQECKKQCGHLTVGIHVNRSFEHEEKVQPVQTVFERYMQLKHCKYVDEVVPYETEEDLVNILAMGNYDIRFLCGDYQAQKSFITGQDIIPIKYIKRTHSYSSTKLRSRLP